MSDKNQDRVGAFYAILSGLCYGPLGYFGVRMMEGGLSVYAMTFWRFVVSAVFMALILGPRLRLLGQDPRAAIRTFLYSGLFYSASTIVYFLASRYIDTGPAMVVFFTYPAVVIVINRFFYGTAISRVTLVAFPLIVVGMVLLVDIQEFKMDFLGLALGLLSALFYGLYIIASKHIRMDPLVSTFLVSLGCATGSGAAAWWDHSLALPSGGTVWAYALGFGVLVTAVPILLLLQALRRINSDKASIYSVTEPVFVVLFGVFLLQEHLTLHHVLGIIIILAGALITLFGNQIKDHPLLMRLMTYFGRRR